MKRRVSWGWLIIALAYGVGVLPISPSDQLPWLSTLAMATYIVLALRTAHTTVCLAQGEGQKLLFVWWWAVKAALINGVLMIGVMFLLAQPVQKVLSDLPAPTSCFGLAKAYCTYQGLRPFQWEQIVLAINLLSLLVLLDQALLVALTLLVNKYVLQSAQFISRSAVVLRGLLASTILSVVVIGLQLLGPKYYYYQGFEFPDEIAGLTSRRIVETVYPSFDPLVTGGVFLTSNILGHPQICQELGVANARTCTLTDTRPFMARQLVVAALGAIMYLLLTVGALRLARPEQSASHEKAKRG